MSHGIEPDPGDLVNPHLSEQVAATMQALAASSRLRILSRLTQSSQSVGELSEAIGMEPSAVSHQLRVLRDLGFVVGERDGKRVNYRLYDEHLAVL
ncbi:MAG: ArsR/SmtB family transcription factor, partial [Solirubrobacterales bacterium]